MGTQIMSVAVSDEVLARAQRLAPIIGLSIEEMLSKILNEAAEDSSSYWEAAALEIQKMKDGDLLHTEGKFDWTREELNGRRGAA